MRTDYRYIDDSPENSLKEHRRRFFRALLALILVLRFGTCGFTLIQDGWDIWKSLYFTIITITTVGYGDYGLNPIGERFTTVLLVVGLATSTYAFGQLVQAAVSHQLAWRTRMQKQIDRLHGHFIVCGIGRVGRAVCDHLAEASLPFVVIETDQQRFRGARSRGYFAIHGSATDDDVLLQASLKRAKGIVCASDSDSENIVITLSARELNPEILIVSRAGDSDSIHKFERAGATHVVSPALNGGNDIANLLIRPHLTAFLKQSHDSESRYRLTEVSVAPDSGLVGQTLKGYGSQEPSLVFVAIQRPDGSTRVRPGAGESFQGGDIVIIVGEPEAIDRMSVAASRGNRETVPG